MQSTQDGPYWTHNDDDVFNQCIDSMLFSDDPDWRIEHIRHSSSDDLLLSPTASFAQPSLSLLTGSSPLKGAPDLFAPVEDAAAFANDIQEEHPSTPDDLLAIDRDHFPLAPAFIPSPAKRNDARGRGRDSPQRQDASRRRNTSGVRKTLRHAQSTPNIGHARYFNGLESLLGDTATAYPPMPTLTRQRSVQFSPGPMSPIGMFREDTFALDPMLASQDTGFNSTHFPSATHQSEIHTPMISPMNDFFNFSSTDDVAANRSPQMPTFAGADMFANELSQRMGRMSVTAETPFFLPHTNLHRLARGDSDLPEYISPWRTTTNMPAPPSFPYDTTNLHSLPLPASMYSPLASPSFPRADSVLSYEQSLPDWPVRQSIEASISPRTRPAIPNFSRPSPTRTFTEPADPNADPALPRINGPSHPQPSPPTDHGPISRRTRSAQRPGPAPPTPRQRQPSTRSTSSTSTPSSPDPYDPDAPSPPPAAAKPKTKAKAAAAAKTKKKAQLTGRGFVNFTASDGDRLLTGVAPSGSAKTKAKREREALEKVRQMSAAAVRAVREGDLGVLKEVGLA